MIASLTLDNGQVLRIGAGTERDTVRFQLCNPDGTPEAEVIETVSDTRRAIALVLAQAER